MNEMIARFKAGDTVLLRSTKEMGRVERDPVLDAGEHWYRVRFTKRVDNVVEEDLEPLADSAESLERITARGSWGLLQAFRTALTVERITNTDQSTIYAFRAQRILFEAFQYKPLLKILESPDRRLLIADEVGLGKTVEAGLILTELEARRPLDRVLIVCPSRLREKWRDEMSRKFDQDFEIVTRADLDEYLLRLSRNATRTRLRAIVSMQTIRNADLRERLLAEIGSIDLVIVDEAHHARNASTQTSKMLSEVCELAEAALLLTATPLHLGNRDLFTLLQALRPSEFRDYYVFDQVLQQHRPVHEVGLLVRSQNAANLSKARGILKNLFEAHVPEPNRNPLAVEVIRRMSGLLPQDGKEWVELERRVQDLHPLASILTRTRKRDVQEVAAVRTARVFRCKWTDAEKQVYRKLIHGADNLGWVDQPLNLGQIQRARQAASCLPAAMQAHGIAQTDDDATELTDILPTDLTDLASTAVPATAGPTVSALAQDSKFDKLLELLKLVDEEEPGAKLIVFTFFVGTSRYLQERLTAHGYPALRIAGDVPSNPKRPDEDERGIIMRQFREEATARVLVSTEVGSEGLDFQFCHYLVNYDLPWNPMVVEQRIGRIDRFGQKADKVHILNLVVEGTVEDRILHRLYDRIGIFQESLGQLEAILGEEMMALQKEYVSGKLTAAEAERRVEQSVRAIGESRTHLEELERNAGNLFGHEEYLKGQLQRVNRLGRYISGRAMLAVIETYLQSQHPNVRVWEEPPGIYNLRLSDGLRRDIQSASSHDNPWSGRTRKGVLSFCFDGEQAYEHTDVELINVSHPFVKVAVGGVSKQLENTHARAARARLVLPPDEQGLEAGTYFVAVFSQVIDGIRARRSLETIAWSESQGILLADAAERLLHLMLECGLECDPTLPTAPMPSESWAKIESEGRARNRAMLEAERQENAALYVRRKSLLEAEHTHAVSVKKTRLATARERGHVRVLPALEAQIVKAEGVFCERLAKLERTKNVSCRLSDPIAVCMVFVEQSSV